jgi:predicted nuclease with TOPRIM domain
MAVNGQNEGTKEKLNSPTNEKDNTNKKNNDKNAEDSEDKNNTDDSNKPNKENNNNKKNNNGSNNKTRVNIITPGEMITYTFTISSRPDTKVGQDGKIIIRMLMREMVHRTPSIIFHPTNSASSPGPSVRRGLVVH